MNALAIRPRPGRLGRALTALLLGTTLEALSLATLPDLAASASGKATPQPPLSRFVERLRAAGRGEVAVTRLAHNPLSDRVALARGRLRLEPPDRLAVAFTGSGERLTLRGDGGEWLQPALRQMLTLGGERAAAAARGWRVLLGEEGSGAIALEPLGGRRYRVTFKGERRAPDQAVLTLDSQGQPLRLEVDEGGEGPTVYTFSGWRFSRARGRADFVITAPPGYEVVPLP